MKRLSKFDQLINSARNYDFDNFDKGFRFLTTFLLKIFLYETFRHTFDLPHQEKVFCKGCSDNETTANFQFDLV